MNPSPNKFIRIRGANEHNLKRIDVEIPRDQLVVVTGLSGSGKSTLAFDTVYAEGQRKYMESLSAYARQFLDQLQKPDVEEIEGLPPTIAIEQRGASSNPRSTVATTTEIYDYLRVLFARAGTPHCWECGREITAQSPSQIIEAVMKYPAGTKLMILSPLVRGQKGEHKDTFVAIHKQGFVRARVDGELLELQNPKQFPALKKTFNHNIEAIVDRIVLKPEIRSRLADSIETALKLSQGLVIIAVADGEKWIDNVFSEKFACPVHPNVSLPELEPRLFSFNSPHGACPECHGLGTLSEFDPDLIVPDESLTLETGAIEAWRKHGKRMNIFYSRVLRQFARDFGISYSQLFKDIPKKVRDILMYGTEAKGDNGAGTEFEGILPNLQRRFENTESEWVKHKLHSYMSEQPCKTCHGTRLKKEAMAVRIHTTDGHLSPMQITTETTEAEPETKKGKKKKDSVLRVPATAGGHQSSVLSLPGYSIDDVTKMNVGDAKTFFSRLRLSEEGQKIAEPIMREISARLGFMFDVGLGYFTLDRKTGTLSGGEAQRIRLATQVGSGLVGVCYVLDEPTIGLHQRDNTRLIRTLHRLRDIGNSVIMVEHDEDCIRESDYLIDIGPGAGAHGGSVMVTSPIADLLNPKSKIQNPKFEESITVKYLTGELSIPVPEIRRPVDPSKNCLELKGCNENNLKNVDARIPLGGLVCVTGVSGSGKSTLINQTLIPALKRKLYASKLKAGEHKILNGASKIDKVIEIDQSPIGRTPRSNPATYTGVFDEIRRTFAKVKEAKIRGYEMGRFSFNVKGGRCESCQGQGTKKIEMHFLPDVYVNCEVCHGTRYNAETLEIHYRGKNIAEVLNMTVEEAMNFFENFPIIHRQIKALNDVGLSYVKIGQPSTQLSGGEAQRVKLATELGKNPTGHTLYVLDEPTTGLHFADIQNLLNVLNRLADLGNTILVIEHNLDVIKCADWLIDLGPEGGSAGGQIIATGTPEDVVDAGVGYTAEYLKPKIRARRPARPASPPRSEGPPPVCLDASPLPPDYLFGHHPSQEFRMKKPSKSVSAPAAGARDRMRASANPVFAKNILEPLFELNAKLFFHPLVAAHRAWLTMLAEESIVRKDRAARILRGLDMLEKDGPDSVRPFDPAVEFYYLHVERALVQRVPGGEAAVGNLNLGRTRPEPLARMVVRDALLRILNSLLTARHTLLKRADAEADTVMPGYTHLLHAQPTTLGHYLLAIHDHLERDTQRLFAAYASVDQCTLGCGAMSGTSLPVDRERVRELLGFEQLCENTIDSVSASDHVTESAAALTTLMTIVGRLSQDLYIWSSQEFAMIDVTDSFASPSSLMPQKKNALVLEYIRSRTARCIAALTGSFAVLHNVGYMDSEEVEIETYRPLFDAITLTEEALPTIDALISVMEPNRPLMAKRAAEGFSSVTALAEAIQTEKDLSYRIAHRIVARAVLLAVERGVDATGIDTALLDQAAVEMIGAPLKLAAKLIAQCLDPRNFIDHHAVIGATAPKEVRRMAAVRRKRIGADEAAVAMHEKTLAAADKTLRQAVAKIIASAAAKK